MSTRSQTPSDRPAPFPYAFRSLLDFPRRIFHPPTPTIGSVRSFKLTPCANVRLADVVYGQHLPPFGRKEFEDYLWCVEHTPENLYFYLWFNDYERAYNQWKQSASYPSPNGKLALSYARAKETFFTPASPHELNLPDHVVRNLLSPATPHPGPASHPPPSAFVAVKYDVENFLKDSLRTFVANNCGNAGRYRGLFAIAVGLITIFTGCIPIILSVLASHNVPNTTLGPHHTHLIRLSSIPVLWFGLATLFAGLQGVCVVIFLFGDARQLHPYELSRPKISLPQNPQVPRHVALQQQDSSPSFQNSTTGLVDNKRPNTLRLQTFSIQSHADSIDLETGSVEDEHTKQSYGSYTPHSERTFFSGTDGIVQDKNSLRTGSPSPTFDDLPYRFDFDAMPLPPNMKRPEWMTSSEGSESTLKSEKSTIFGIPVQRSTFAPLTKVLSPLVTRAQWVIVMRSSAVALVLAIAIGASSLAIR